MAIYFAVMWLLRIIEHKDNINPNSHPTQGFWGASAYLQQSLHKWLVKDFK